MISMKFGGTSVGHAEAIGRVASIIESRISRQPLVVLSAVGGVTDRLLKLCSLAAAKESATLDDEIEKLAADHRTIISELGMEKSETLNALVNEVIGNCRRLSETIKGAGNPIAHATDEMMSQGELLSTNILAEFLTKKGTPAQFADARQILVTDSNFSKAQPLYDESVKNANRVLSPMIEGGVVPVIQGFIGSDQYGRVTTLGRGGSDYSATLFGAMLGAEAVEIWSDVDGVLSADPSLVPEAKRILTMSFQEAAELAYFGAKVLHPATLLPAIERNIPVYVLNSMRPGDSGTRIARSAPKNSGDPGVVKSIAYKEDLTVVTVTSSRMLMSYGFMASIFEIFNRFNTSVDLVSTSEVTVSMTVDDATRLQEIKKELEHFSQVEIAGGKAIVCLVGEQMKRTKGMPAQIFGLLDDIEIHLISQGASEINISFVIDEPDLPRVVTRLHDHFFSGPLDETVFAV